MSRKGKMPVEIPNGVEVTVQKNVVSVKGPKGTLTQEVHKEIAVEIQEKEILVTVITNPDDNKKFQGLYRSLIQNMVQGVSAGFSKTLEMIGVGYRAAVKGNLLDLQLGFSHPTQLPIPTGLEVKVENNTKVTVSGADKQAVGQYAADIRAVRPPEVYKGKGVRYQGEYVRRKAGKTGKGK